MLEVTLCRLGNSTSRRLWQFGQIPCNQDKVKWTFWWGKKIHKVQSQERMIATTKVKVHKIKKDWEHKGKIINAFDRRN